MNRVAVFVDAGYFFAQGSTAIWGAKQPRSSIELNEENAIGQLTAFATTKAPNTSLLRIYWYDGAFGRPSLEQSRVARLDNVKVRLGFLNSAGQQKGVDSLIVTDLVELARNSAMTDAVLLSGDEDIRIGVVIAQSFGVRIHLLGITPSRGSQSPQLMHEADTTSEWDKAMMQKMLARKEQTVVVVDRPSVETTTSHTTISAVTVTTTEDASAALNVVTDTLLESLTSGDIDSIKEFWATGQGGVPKEFDGKLIATGGVALGRKLTSTEMRNMRKRFSDFIRR